MTVKQTTLRHAIQDGLAANRARFLEALAQVRDADLGLRGAGSAWTVGELLTHLTWSFELLPKEISKAREGKGMFNYPRLIRDPANAFIARRGGRGQTVERLRERYEAAYEAALATLQGLREEDMTKGAKFWGEGFFDIAALYSAQSDHLDEHLPAIASCITGIETAAR